MHALRKSCANTSTAHLGGFLFLYYPHFYDKIQTLAEKGWSGLNTWNSSASMGRKTPTDRLECVEYIE